MMKTKWRLQSVLFGNPIPDTAQEEQKLPIFQALAIFSSDALSSVAYATEEILNVLILAGVGALAFSIHLAFCIALLIVIVGISYRQAIEAYPRGGGAYSVARKNLGTALSLVAAAALLLDYTLTVAVSITAGVRALDSAFPLLDGHAVLISVLGILFMMWLNLRGTKEAGVVFTLPTYLFVAFILGLIGVGVAEYAFGDLHPVAYGHHAHLLMPHMGTALTTILILRAFSSGCSAMTGIEAVSNGVSAFKRPAADNARKTLTWLMVLLIIMFVGISFLALKLHIRPSSDQSVLSQMGHAFFGNSVLYYGLQFATVLILLLAANTSFAGFPRLASMIAQDNFLPRPLKALGDRLAFSNGITLLAILAIMLVIGFNADTHALIPLYSIGVFIAFTLCQAGLVVFWCKKRAKRWPLKATINGIGALCTAAAVVVIIESKFTEGAWVSVVIIGVLLWVFYKIRQHYRRSDRELQVRLEKKLTGKRKSDYPLKVLVPISKIHPGTIAALEFAHRLSSDVTAVSISTHSEKNQKLKAQWHKLALPGKLVILSSRYQSITWPLIRRIRRMDRAEPERGLTVVVIPKSRPSKWWQYFLHNQQAVLFRLALNSMSRQENQKASRVIVEVPYQLSG